MAGIAAERITHLVSSWRDASPDVVQRTRAEAGLDEAEDWLFRAFESGDVPRARNVHAPQALQRIEAVRSDGGGFDAEAAFPGVDLEIFIADASFDVAIFPSNRPPYAIPVVAHEPPSAENGNRWRYYYFLRSRAGSDGRDYRTVCEELLQFEIDAAFGTIADVRRIFFRSGSEPR